MEKELHPVSGYTALVVAIVLLILAGVSLIDLVSHPYYLFIGAALFCISIFIFKGVTIVNPNQAAVCVFFGKYVGSVKTNGLKFVNPFFKKYTITLRATNFDSAILKVNDQAGNPIQIAAVIVWKVKDTYKACFDVSSYASYVTTQSEAAIRHMANSFPYDNLESNTKTLTLRESTEEVSQLLEKELNERLAFAGIEVLEARISHLAYAPEIAGAMLQRQQAAAIVAAKEKIVEGAVSMVEGALQQISKRHIVELDESKKAQMVANLLVVLCGERGVAPVVRADE